MGQTKDRLQALLRRGALAPALAASLALGVGALGVAEARERQTQATKGAGADDEVDHVALAAMLLRDGHHDRAETVLSRVDLDQEGVDLKTYHTLRGLLRLRIGAHAEAIAAFEAAIENGQHDDSVFVYLAQCYYGLRNWERTIQSVENAQDEATKYPELFMMRAEAELNLGRRPDAWRTLSRGAERFTDRPEFERQQTFLLIEMGLFQEAAERGRRYLARIEPGPADYVALAMAFKKGAHLERALEMLELAKLRFPDDDQLVLHLARAYTESGKLRAAADLLQRSAELDPTIARESAELFKRAAEFERALYMNALQGDQPEKFKQRVSILLDQRKFEEVSAMDRRLERLGVLDDQNVLYALAYAKFQVGDFASAEPYLKRIQDPQLFEYATQLRRMIAVCEKDPGQCG